MLITKFNRLIRNRILWAVFAVIVCCSFVLMGFAGRSGCDDESSRQGVAGRIFSEDISTREFFLARFYEMGMRDRPGMSLEANDMIRKRTWQRLACLRTARDMGLAVWDEEIGEVIRKDPSFQNDGVFSKDRYRSVVESQLRVNVQTFEDYVRQDLLIRKLMQVMQSVVWTSPAEVTRRLVNLTDLFRIEYAVLTADRHTGDVEVSLSDAEAYFEENKELFTEAEKINVLYLDFPISNHLSSAGVSEEEIVEYYDKHLADYPSSTNENAEPLPLEDVREGIATMLTRERATFLARDAATEFVMELVPGRYTEGRSLQGVADARGMTILTTDYFTAVGEVPGLNVGYEFNRVAFSLDKNDPDAFFSDAIVSEDSVYVIVANDRIEERIPEFGEVTNAAFSAAEAQAKREALFERSNQIREATRAHQESGGSFAEALAKYDVNVSTTETFTVYEGLGKELEFSDTVLPAIMTLQQGQLTECLTVPVGTLLAHVTERQPGDIASAQLLRPRLQATLSRYRAGILYEDWADHLLDGAELEDFMASVDEEEDDSED